MIFLQIYPFFLLEFKKLKESNMDLDLYPDGSGWTGFLSGSESKFISKIYIYTFFYYEYIETHMCWLLVH
jgi:hypothetical protein